MLRLKLLVLALPFVVGACTDGATTSEFPARLSVKPGLETVAVAQGEIVVGGPAHYCVDQKGSRLSGNAALVLLASCATISGDTSLAYPPVPALLTATVEKRTSESPDPADILALVTSSQGRAVLARDGRADSVTILSALLEGNSVLLRVDDQSADTTPGLETIYWRGLFTVNGRLITTTVVGFDGQNISAESGLDMLKAFENRIRKESPDSIVSDKPSTLRKRENGLFRNILR